MLLHGHREPEAARPWATQAPMATLTVGRLLGSVLLSLVTLVLVGTLVLARRARPVRARGRRGRSPVRWPSTC